MPPEVAATFNRYPEAVRQPLLQLRQLLIETARENACDNSLQECLKWGEPSYLCRGGSTIRLAWNAKYPDQYGLYFNCKSKLVATFSEMYADVFRFENNRAMLFQQNAALPVNEIKHCLALALTYHKRKHLPLLGA
jgi:hypothetical protein